MTERQPQTPKEISSLDFTYGVLEAVTRKRQHDFLFRPFDPGFNTAMKAAYDRLVELEASEGVRSTFMIMPHQIYGESETLVSAVLTLAQDGLLEGRKGRSLLYRYDPDGENGIRKATPNGSEALYDELAGVFVENLQ